MKCLILCFCWVASLVQDEAALAFSPPFSLTHNHHHHPAYGSPFRSTHLALVPQQLGHFAPLELSNDDKRCRWVRLESWLDRGAVPYPVGLQRQQALWRAQSNRLQQNNKDKDVASTTMSSFYNPSDQKNYEDGGNGIDTILMLEHTPVYTLGTGSDASLISTLADPQVPIERIGRGGEVTYHGPGQLVVYPVLDLRSYRQDIHWYMRALEEAILLALQDVGLDMASRDEETTGVWINQHKVAAVGIGARQWITQHGLALNVEETALPHFQHIVPCGLHGRKVGCVNQFLPASSQISVAQMAISVQAALEHVFGIQLYRT